MALTGGEKARRAAAHPDGRGEQCKAEHGGWRPVVDRARCGAKRDRVDVCPYGPCGLCAVACAEGALHLVAA